MKKLLKLCILLNGLQQFVAIDVGGGDSSRNKSVGSSQTHRTAFTWMGLLMTKDNVPPEHLLRSSTIIILISEGLAIGVAKDIVGLDPETIEAMFWLADGSTWRCDVEEYVVHPDHSVGKEALALVVLIPPSEFFIIQGLPINWTISDYVPSPATVVGLAQDVGIIRQTQKQVVTCDKSHCDAFYATLAGQSAINTMPRYSCYYEHLVNLSFCEYRSGMALVYRTESGYFNLFAIAVGGPGCGSCSRWIHFHPYREWIQQYSGPSLRSTRSDQGMYDYYEDLDQELITNLYKNKDRKELKWKWPKEDFAGECWMSRKQTLVYREQMHFISKLDSSYASYALSLYDLIYKHVTCAWLRVNSKKRSPTRWWTTRGFQQDDIDYYVKKVPISIDGRIKPKIIFLMDKYRKYHEENIRVSHLEFQFSFDQEAELEIQYHAEK